jgi:hypothetical protein
MTIPFKFGKTTFFTEKIIGEIFFYEGISLVCVESDYCNHNNEDCYFWGKGKFCKGLKCTPDKRSDLKSVCFINFFH